MESPNTPGSFCFIELGTTDIAAAKAFYGALFGWNATDKPIGPGGAYTFFRLEEKNAAGGYRLQKEQIDRGVLPHWLLYVAAPDADAAAKKAAELGGAAVMPPFDVMDAGRLAVLRDPAGAAFALWQAKRHKGLGVIDVPGALCWADLSVPNAEKAIPFYEKMFGWHIDAGDEKSSGYRHIKLGDRFLGGVPAAAQRNPNAPPHWLAYLQVADCKASAEKAKSLGATLHLPPKFMENVGTISVIADP